MEQDRTADTAAPPITSDADASKIGDERERIFYTRDRILQIREDIEISEDILKVKQLIEAEFDDTKSEDLQYQGRERICYSIDQLLRLQEVAKIPEDILKIKKEFDAETKVDDPVHWEQMEEYPQRPGEPECSYFIKYGTCKFESTCKFHHPSPTNLGGLTMEANVWLRHQGHLGHSEIPGEADWLPTMPLCIISPAGLPLRPGQQTCSYYSRFGTCKFGPQCRFDHPMDMHDGYSVPAADPKHGQG